MDVLGILEMFDRYPDRESESDHIEWVEFNLGERFSLNDAVIRSKEIIMSAKSVVMSRRSDIASISVRIALGAYPSIMMWRNEVINSTISIECSHGIGGREPPSLYLSKHPMRLTCDRERYLLPLNNLINLGCEFQVFYQSYAFHDPWSQEAEYPSEIVVVSAT